ncbi:GNAT family N-acetyltransferase [Actinokineospora sp.]|uniref:GNAT family N-acetyltransferase n=1 Tax=Actinokineospora sp. TaxID=1872133 RepID=UPI003D6B1C7F
MATPTYEFASHERFPAGLIKGRKPLLVGGRTGYHNELLSADHEPGANGALSALLTAISDRAQARGYDCLLLDHLTSDSLRALEGVFDAEFSLRSAEAVIHNPGGTFDTYLESIGGRKAYKIRNEAKKFARSGLTIDTASLAECVDDAIPLVIKTMQRYGHEVDHADVRSFMDEQVRCVDGESIVFRCRDEAGTMIGCAVCFVWSDALYFRVCGFDYERLRGAYEYFNTAFYRPLRFMTDNGLTRLHLGTGPLDAKSQRGATVHPLWACRIDLPLRAGGLRGLDQDADVSLRSELLPQGASVVDDEWVL